MSAPGRILPLIAAHTVYDILGFLLAHVHLTVALFGIDWLDVLLALTLIPVALLADHALSTLRRHASTRAPQAEAGQ